MSLPDGFLDELRSRLSLGQVVGRKVAWDMRRSNQAKGDLWAPCPFHEEKTASFHVDDRKGFYYCFGCHKKGDAIAFVRETENVGFMEAVGILAREAGMTLPQRDPREQERSDRRTRLADVMEQAVRHYRLQLKTAAAGSAREYLARRGLSPEALERWEIGFAPDARRGVLDALGARGIDEALAVDAGLAARPDDGGPAFDRFRGRIIFPIRDARGRAIALGGRSMDPGARAKYLNSPQTDLFDKGRTLFNHGPAREAAGRGETLILAEGYMDVIALVEAGFTAVAPLGTAVTEEQLRLLWRIHPEPVVALDGDASGLKAALRLVDLALPLVEAGQSLRFALMPGGMDPDELIRAQGREAMRQVVEAAEPMVALLWRRETEGRTFDSPERRAALDRALGEATRRIRDPGLRTHYTDELKRLRWDLFNPRRAPTRRRTAPPPSRDERRRLDIAGRFGQAREPAARGSALTVAGEHATEAMHEAVILATLVRHPALLHRFEGELERLEMTGPGHDPLRHAILAHHEAEDLRAAVVRTVGMDALDRLTGAPHVRLSPGLGEDADRAAMCLAEQLAKLSARRGVRRELEEALGKADTADENVLWRLGRAAEALSGAEHRQDMPAEYEIGPNGAEIRRDERHALDALIGSIDFRGGRRGRD